MGLDSSPVQRPGVLGNEREDGDPVGKTLTLNLSLILHPSFLTEEIHIRRRFFLGDSEGASSMAPLPESALASVRRGGGELQGKLFAATA